MLIPEMTSNREFQSSGLNYIHVDVANHFAMGSVDEFLTSRKCSDAVLVFQSDEDFGQAVRFIIAGNLRTLLRVIIVSDGGDGNPVSR